MNLNQSQTGPKRKLSFIVRDAEEPCHRSGVSALQFDPIYGKLFTGGSDTIIRIWSVPQHKDAFSARGGVRSPGKISPVQYQGSLEEHTDWVTDMIICAEGRVLMSSSNDTTVKVWNIERDNRHTFTHCLKTHKDYVSCMAYAPLAQKAVSASFDQNIFVYDIDANFKTVQQIMGCKNSIYSLACTPNLNLVLASGTEKIIRLFDPRTNEKHIKLRSGHTDNVRALLVNDDGTLALSAGSDATIRLWDIGQQRCIATCLAHEEGVWTLQVDSAFSTVYSSGKDRMVVKTSLYDFTKSQLLFKEEAPVKKMLLCEKESPCLWVGTWQSDIKRQQKKRFAHGSPPGYEEGVSAASIKKHLVLNDKRHVLTKNSAGNVELYDVLAAKKVKEYGDRPLEEVFNENFKKVFVPSWFSVDFKSGMLQITLDELDVFASWLSSKDAGFEDNDRETKVNYGGMMLRSLFEKWPHNDMANTDGDGGEETQRATANFLSLPEHTPFIVWWVFFFMKKKLRS
uniref:WD_REPEATS_REGION domain-containing protein n=1 Tax=Caenorhabditis japonica TaxID=281687 RepID=A0A8R1E521_CAEJA